MATTHDRAGAGSYVAAVLIPVVGFILAIVQFSRGNVGPGFALLLTSFTAGCIWAALLLGAWADSYDQCLRHADTFREQMKC